MNGEIDFDQFNAPVRSANQDEDAGMYTSTNPIGPNKCEQKMQVSETDEEIDQIITFVKS